ncbi:MAG: hypothetical protein ABI377_00365 [Devosia sp.]
MKSPRLLPVVIFATAALLTFKGIGLVTNGGYVLGGPSAAHAAEGGDSTASVENAAPRTEPTMSDASPTLADTSPTVASPAAAAHGGEGEAPAPVAAASASRTAPAATAAPSTNAVAAANSVGAAPDAGPTVPPVAGPADAAVTTTDSAGHSVTLAAADGTASTDDVILQRLAQRRAELDKRDADLKMREAIVAAAEKQMTERGDALKALEAQITALSQQKQAMEDQQFAGIVKLYENMKPQEAATIFDGLDLNVLLRVAKAMDPRKMSPILAKMTAARAQELTMQLAATDANPSPAVSTVATADPNALPQIVGH